MADWTQEEVNKAITNLTSKSAVNKEFRRTLLQHPERAIEQETGKKIPPGYRIRVIEADPEYDQTFVLPPMVSESLSDEELEEVAGGSACLSDIPACAGMSCTVKTR